MKVYYKTIYVANDGKEFDNQADCAAHEKDNSRYAEIKNVLKEVRDICKNHVCDNCPLACYNECFSRNENINDGTYCVEPCDWIF